MKNIYLYNIYSAKTLHKKLPKNNFVKKFLVN